MQIAYFVSMPLVWEDTCKYLILYGHLFRLFNHPTQSGVFEICASSSGTHSSVWLQEDVPFLLEYFLDIICLLWLHNYKALLHFLFRYIISGAIS